MKIFLPSDRIPVLVGEFKFLIAPLTYGQRLEMAEAIKMVAGAEVKDYPALSKKAVRMCVRSVETVSGEPLTDARGAPLNLECDESGYLSEESLEMLMQLQELPGLASACMKLWSGIKAVDDLPGVKVDLENVVKIEKKGVASAP